MKHSNAVGFSIIEFLLYLILLISIATIGGYWITSSWSILRNYTSSNVMMLNMHIARDFLARDVHRAASDKNLWKKIDLSEIIFHAADTDIGWCLKKDRLLRTEGEYDQSKHVWHKKKQSIVASPVKKVIFQVEGQKQVNRIIITYTVIKNKKDEVCKQVVMLQNRELV